MCRGASGPRPPDRSLPAIPSSTMTVNLEVDEGIGTIRLDRPPMNALDATTQDRLREVAEGAARRDDVRAVVLWGGEKLFAAGADIKEMQGMSYEDMAVRAPVLQE